MLSEKLIIKDATRPKALSCKFCLLVLLKSNELF